MSQEGHRSYVAPILRSVEATVQVQHEPSGHLASHNFQRAVDAPLFRRTLFQRVKMVENLISITMHIQKDAGCKRHAESNSMHLRREARSRQFRRNDCLEQRVKLRQRKAQLFAKRHDAEANWLDLVSPSSSRPQGEPRVRTHA